MSLSLAISVENVSKRYRLGLIDRGVLFHELRDAVNRVIWGKASVEAAKPDINEFWALRDINFDLKEGETVAFIGRNGAGKSTLLKILSRTTAPTTGRIRLKGRVGSLLEVGTGFHPELTGRENVYLYGSILGMSQGELESKFDDIVSFAELEKFIDTPVKRYSSGMYVRLGFSVAAFLEPEILIVDEALSVGDASFQAKCIERIKTIINDGRTFLFVSHSGSIVQEVCKRSIYLSHGRVVFDGDTKEALEKYNAAEGVPTPAA